MGKSDFLTPKAIANRIANQRQMAIFGQAPDRIVDGFSDEFLKEFLTLLRRAHRSSRVAATVKVLPLLVLGSRPPRQRRSGGNN